ncbi:MAG: arginine deiminase family protein [Planctomycetota bacterium]
MQLYIANEYDRLDTVLVHRPGEEIDRLTHDNMRRFLFEDIPFLTGMQEEHDEFVGDMQDHDIRVLYLEILLLELFNANPMAKTRLIEQICQTEQCNAIMPDLLDVGVFPNDRLVRILFSGITNGEFYELTGRPPLEGSARGTFILPPIPNAYFSRDPAVVIGRCVISCKMHYTERVRETLLVRSVLENHREFAGHTVAYGGSQNPTEDRPFTIEGGDVIVLNEEAVLIGVSERTRSETIKVFARKAFSAGHAKRCYEIPIPTERTFMHLDTVFTIVDRGVVVWYPGVMEQIKQIEHFAWDAVNGVVVRKPESRSLTQILSDEFGRELKVIRTGGGDEHYASREQRTDGTNLLAVAPGVACTYRRNVKTIQAMEKAGIKIIAISGSELVRGLGGPRCMTMPLSRKV